MHKRDRPPPTSFLPPESWGSCGGSLTHHKLSVKSTSQSSSLSLPLPLPTVDDLCQVLEVVEHFRITFFHRLLRHIQHQQKLLPHCPVMYWLYKSCGFSMDLVWCQPCYRESTTSPSPSPPLNITSYSPELDELGQTFLHLLDIKSTCIWVLIKTLWQRHLFHNKARKFGEVSKASWWQQMIFGIKSLLLHLEEEKYLKFTCLSVTLTVASIR